MLVTHKVLVSVKKHVLVPKLLRTGQASFLVRAYKVEYAAMTVDCEEEPAIFVRVVCSPVHVFARSICVCKMTKNCAALAF